MIYEEIQTKLDAVLAALSLDIRIIDENTSQTRPNTLDQGIVDNEYIETVLLPSEPERVTLGEVGWDNYIGLYQINLFIPADYSAKRSNYLADQIIAGFKPRDFLTEGSPAVTIRVEKVWKEAAFNATQWQVTPIVIRWASFYQR